MNKNKKFKFSFDLGAKSIGWAVYELNENLDPTVIAKTGVRIFSDGRQAKTGESLAVNRRVARTTRRRRDRFIKRKQALMRYLIDFGLMPKDEFDRQELKKLDVYKLRAKAVNEKIEFFEIGRIFYHLNQRRGFLSIRKSLTAAESKVNEPRVKKLKRRLVENNYKSLGEYLYSLNQVRKPLRFVSDSQYFPDRDIYLEEFNRIVSLQKLFYPNISEENWLKIKSIIFFQRPLKTKVDNIGQCVIFVDKKRAPKSSIYFQRYCLLKSLADLKTINKKGHVCEISIESKIKLYNKLSTNKEISFDKLRRELKLEPDFSFNLENIKNKKIHGDGVSKKLKDILEEEYANFSLDELNEIATLIASDKDDDYVSNKLISLGVSEDLIDELLELELPHGYCFLSHEALIHLVARLEREFCSSELIISDLKGNETDSYLNPFLKYYGEMLPASVTGADKQGKSEEIVFGRISNPTFHICLNQLRKIVNELIETYGVPLGITYEVARELKINRNVKSKIDKKKKEIQIKNERVKNILIKEQKILTPSRQDIEKYKLWEELNIIDSSSRRCPYSLKIIPIQKLFTAEVEVVFILPFSRTLDASFANKTVAYRKKNQEKGNLSPFEAFCNERNGKYNKVLINILKLPENKKWRFLPDAMEKYSKENEFFTKQLEDTAYFSKISKKYLESICTDVVVIPGFLTALIRHYIGLNSILDSCKIEGRVSSYKKHAINALVIGLTTKPFLQKISNLSSNPAGNIIIGEPFLEFRTLAQKSIDTIFVSRKEDHGIEARFHEDTYYGIVNPNNCIYEKEHGYNLVARRSLSDLKEKDIGSIRSLNIRKEFEKEAFVDVVKKLRIRGTRKLRLLKKDKSVQIISHPKENYCLYKGIIAGDNHSLEVWKVPPHKDKTTGAEKSEELKFIVYNFYEKAKKMNKIPHPSAKKLFTLHKGDNILMKKDNEMILVNLRTIRPSKNLIGVVPIDSSTRLDKETEWPTFSSFSFKEIRKVKITAGGKLLDPGNPYI